MNPLDTEFHRRLLKRIEQQVVDDAAIILTGNLDPEEYKRRCGYLKALEDAKDWCADINQAMNEGK